MRITGSTTLAVIVLIGALGGACGAADSDENADSLRVFAAASLTDAFNEIADAFERAHPDTTVVFSFAGSSSLREQILAGAPADVFASANPSNMEQVVADGAADEPSAFAANTLEIAVPAGNPSAISGLDDLARDELLVGLCAPEVPCGALALDVLDNAGVTPSVDTEEPDVRALLTKVEAGELDAGIVYRTDVRSTDGGVDAVPISRSVNATTLYEIAPLAETDAGPLAESFVAFVLSPDGQAILGSYGFSAP